MVQSALRIVLEPIFEATFLPCSYGFRPGRDAHRALKAMREAVRAGRTWVVDADIEHFYDRLGHDLALECVRERVSDRRVLRLIRAILRAGVLEGSVLSRPEEGAPQGGPISPLIANVVLHRLDRAWGELPYRRLGVIVRYADDVVVCCPTRERAEAALAALASILQGLGLTLATSKTQIVGMASGERGVDFLGFHHRMIPSRRWPRLRYPARWPSNKAMAQAKARIREITARSRCHDPTHHVVAELNEFLRGWRCSSPNATPNRAEGTGCRRSSWPATTSASNGWPDPSCSDARECRPVKDVGKPCEAAPHARFEGGAEETHRCDDGLLATRGHPSLVVHEGPGEQTHRRRQRASALPDYDRERS